MVSVYPFYELSLYPHLRGYSFGLRDIATLMNRFMGSIKYEDKPGKYWRYERLETLIEMTRENFEANGYTKEEMRQVLSLISPLPA